MQYQYPHHSEHVEWLASLSVLIPQRQLNTEMIAKSSVADGINQCGKDVSKQCSENLLQCGMSAIVRDPQPKAHHTLSLR
eukprot:2825473-Amphidinium_carterae.2